MRVTRLLHASVNVEGDLAATRRFYTDVLGLTSAHRPTIEGVEGHWFELAGAQLHLVDAPVSEGIAPTAHHVCLGVEDLDAAIQELEANGVSHVRGAQGAVDQVWIVDPCGNTIELQQDPALGAS